MANRKGVVHDASVDSLLSDGSGRVIFLVTTDHVPGSCPLRLCGGGSRGEAEDAASSIPIHINFDL